MMRGMMPMPQMSAGAPQPPQTPAGPQGAPMAQPSPNDGAKQMGIVQVETAMQLMEQALPTLGSNTEEGAAVLKAMTALAKAFNRQKSKDLVPAQIQEMARTQQQSPMAQAMAGPPGGAAPQPAM
jgi:hypothetical protein